MAAMSRDEQTSQPGASGSRRPRPLSRAQLPPGPLRELKDLLYQLYVQAGRPTLDEITDEVAADDDLVGSLSRDSIRRCISDRRLPPRQPDVVAVATVLARLAGKDVKD